MKRFYARLFFSFLLLAVPTTAFAQLSAFQGNWRNIDPATQGVTRLQIDTSPNVTVHAWGQCSPSDCDWGTVGGFAYGPNASSNLNTSARAITALFTTSFSQNIVVIRPAAGGRLQADVYDRFTDASGRTAYVGSYTFDRERERPGGPVGRVDCLPYRPANLRIVNEGASGWLLTDGSSRMLMLDNRLDAERALAVARQHNAHCFIGRDNNRPNRKDYIMEWWRGGPGATAMPGDDCISYNTGSLRIENEGANGWLLTDGSSRMVMLHDRSDAQQALTVARRFSRQCYIGRNNTRPNRKDYIVLYWR